MMQLYFKQSLNHSGASCSDTELSQQITELQTSMVSVVNLNLDLSCLQSTHLYK